MIAPPDPYKHDCEELTWHLAHPPVVLCALRLWDTSTGKLIETLEHQSRFGHAVFSADGKFIVSPLMDPKPPFNEGQTWAVRKWDTGRREDLGAKAMAAEGPRMGFACMALSADGKFLATSLAHDISIWDLATGKLVSHRSCVEECKIFRNGRVVYYWQIGSIAFSPDGKRVVATGGAGTTGVALVVDVLTGSKVLEATRVDGCLGAALFTPDGEMVLGACAEGLRLWDVTTGKTRFTLKNQTGQ